MKTIITSNEAPAAIGAYSHAIEHNNLVYTSGQLPIDPATMAFVEGGIKEQTSQSLKNVQAILETANSSIDCVIKTTCFISDMNNFSEFNEIYESVFGSEKAPARSCVEVARLPKDALVEIEAIAFIK